MFERRTIHEVQRGSNLDLILRGFNGAINRFADAVGGGLQAIAVALSTPHDNSAEVTEFTNRIKKQVDALDAAANQQQSR